MIDITAKLVNGSTFFTSETIECMITFSCPKNKSLEKAQSNEISHENLAWASAQIHCQCSINEKYIIADKVKANYKPTTVNTNTTFAPSSCDNGHDVLNTKPKILFCDLKILPGESKSFTYKEIIPNNSPPSYRGQAVKYSYKISIGTQRVNSPTKLLRIPFRVLSLKEIPDGPICSDGVDLSPSNPFLETPKESPVELAMQSLQNITARRNPNFYNITNGRGRVVRFCLFKNSYKLGEDIVGTFDFSNATVSCTQVSVTLQSEEHIVEDFKRGKALPALSSFNKHHEVVIGFLCTHLMLPIPFHITPEFSSELVNLKWKLHFEFVTTMKPIEHPNEETLSWQAPSSVDVETMVWDLPVHIYSTTIPPNITPLVQNSIVM
ncbi:PREDICTED: RAB6A-GEF complex partner protein 2 [Ceratosolen solmsi marchali]|uniref:RAB6A-GEF complex partner protein 2 n=1 Tax=Ceratosolen solmsi marchali TaxID=326594 RepID=A0AAJ6YT43_9HYME|nr:PREDICTED: RAB6A-GEF complex partner protein 2 [Ceratosolen solmsi marchali]